MNTIIRDGKTFAKVAKSSEIKEKEGYFFEIDDLNEVAVFRVKGRLYCLSNNCPHQHNPKIFKGFINDNSIICPLHGWSFSLETGKNLSVGRGLETYIVFEENNIVYIEVKNQSKPKWKL